MFRPDLRLNARSDRLVLDHIKCKQGALGAYLPGLLFGRSPLVGWSETQVRMLQGIIREQTRAADDFLVVDGARYPWLTPGRQYASFNNNFSGRWHGAGYRIMSRSEDCWLYKAGYGGLYNGGDGNPAPIALPLVQAPHDSSSATWRAWRTTWISPSLLRHATARPGSRWARSWPRLRRGLHQRGWTTGWYGSTLRWTAGALEKMVRIQARICGNP